MDEYCNNNGDLSGESDLDRDLDTSFSESGDREVQEENVDDIDEENVDVDFEDETVMRNENMKSEISAKKFYATPNDEVGEIKYSQNIDSINYIN